MIDFKKDVFKNERKSLQTFANNKLVTKEEKENRIDMNDDFEGAGNVLDIDSIVSSGDSFQLNGSDGGMGSDDLMGFDSMDDLFGGSSGSSGSRDVDYDVSQDNSHRTGVWWKDFLFSPFFLILYVSKKIIYDVPNKEDLISILKSLNTITIFTALTSFIFWLIGFKFLFNLGFQALASTIMFIISFSILKFVFKENINIPFVKKEEEEKADDLGFGMNDDMDFSMLDVDDDFSNFGDGTGLSLQTDTGDNDFTFLENDEDVFEDTDTDGHYILPMSRIDVSSKDEFNRTLLEAYKMNSKYQGVEIPERKKLIQSFSDFIISNDKNFGKWRNVVPRSKEGLNMLYAIYKGLVQINTTFGKDEEEMIVIDIKENPLLIKVEVELPDYFKEKMILANLRAIEKMLIRDEMDDKVSVNIAFVQGRWIFKLLRLDNKNLISLGDIFRFYDEATGKTALDDFENPKLGMPILVGLKGNEYPYVIDFEANTSGVVVGGSNSGKSWFVFSVMTNFVYANDYNNVHFIIMDKKASPMWKAFAKFPHVLGHHTDIYQYVELMREVLAEMNRRKELLATFEDAEDIKGLREMLREEGRYEELKQVPLFTVIIDEISATLNQLKTYYGTENKELYDEFVGALSTIAFEGRSMGVRVLLIGQRATDASIPRNVLMNASFKFGMRLESESEYEHLLDKGATKMKKPDSIGMGLLKSLDTKELSLLKTLTIGGKNNSQMITFIRVLALEWVRRSINQDDLYNIPKGMKIDKLYNRNKFYAESLAEIREGRILSPNIVSEDAKLIETEIQGKRSLEDVEPKKVEHKFGKTENTSLLDDDDDFDFINDDDDDDFSLDIDSNILNEDYTKSSFGSSDDSVNLDDEILDDDDDSDSKQKDENTNVDDVDYKEEDISAFKTLKNILSKKKKKNNDSVQDDSDSNSSVNSNENNFIDEDTSFKSNVDFPTVDLDDDDDDDVIINLDKNNDDFNSLNGFENDFEFEEDLEDIFENTIEDEIEKDSEPKFTKPNSTTSSNDFEDYEIDLDKEVKNMEIEKINEKNDENSIEDSIEKTFNNLDSDTNKVIDNIVDFDDDDDDDDDFSLEETDFNIDELLTNVEKIQEKQELVPDNETIVENSDIIIDKDILNKKAISDINNNTVNETSVKGNDSVRTDYLTEKQDNFNENENIILDESQDLDLDEIIEVYTDENNDLVGTDTEIIKELKEKNVNYADDELDLETFIKNTSNFSEEDEQKIIEDMQNEDIFNFKASFKSSMAEKNKKPVLSTLLNINSESSSIDLTAIAGLQEEISNTLDEDDDLSNLFNNLNETMNEKPKPIVTEDIKEEAEMHKKALKEAEELERVRKERLLLEQEKSKILEEKRRAEEEIRMKEQRLKEEQNKALKYIEEAKKLNTSSKKSSSNSDNAPSKSYSKVSDVKKFIIQYGEKKGVRKRIIACDLLEQNFSPPLIKECLDNNIIIKNGNSYLIII